ncbi:MAG: hypothetical protein IJC23_03130, partial [Bacteroidaceae bacterium]|nr:hypothetical protein [Bacteroidaceae bacterium]
MKIRAIHQRKRVIFLGIVGFWHEGRVNQQVQYYSINLKKHSFGVQKFSFSLGLAFNLCCVFFILPSVTI